MATLCKSESKYVLLLGLRLPCNILRYRKTNLIGNIENTVWIFSGIWIWPHLLHPLTRLKLHREPRACFWLWAKYNGFRPADLKRIRWVPIVIGRVLYPLA